MSPMKRKFISAIAGIQLAAAATDCAFAQQNGVLQPGGVTLHVPSSVEAEHERLDRQLSGLAQASGRTGAVARDISALMPPHFQKEEELAMPALGLLPGLASGDLPGDVQGPLRLINRMQAELPQMLGEHRRIREKLELLKEAARDEGNAEAARFSERLTADLEEEEQVLYPAVILAGEYLRLRYRTGIVR